jgi:hypothetical protein
MGAPTEEPERRDETTGPVKRETGLPQDEFSLEETGTTPGVQEFFTQSRQRERLLMDLNRILEPIFRLISAQAINTENNRKLNFSEIEPKLKKTLIETIAITLYCLRGDMRTLERELEHGVSTVRDVVSSFEGEMWKDVAAFQSGLRYEETIKAIELPQGAEGIVEYFSPFGVSVEGVREETVDAVEKVKERGQA